MHGDELFVWGIICGWVTLLFFMWLGVRLSRDGECSHKWNKWTEPDAGGRQKRRCKKCNLEQELVDSYLTKRDAA